MLGKKESEYSIQVSHLRKCYKGKIAVDNLSLSIKKGEVFGLLGHNGAGKSTTIDCILGLKKFEAGSAEILGMDPVKQRKQLFERVGVQLQSSCYQSTIKVGELCEEVSALFSVVPPMGAEMERLGCVCALPEYCFNIYHDGEYKEENIDVEVCEAVTEKKEDSDMLTFKIIEKVETAACVLHKGPYGEFPKAYAAVLRWVKENGFEIIGNPRESYIDGVWNKNSEEDWLTEIQFPVRKISQG
jgi:effector-binding domain-containing protein